MLPLVTNTHVHIYKLHVVILYVEGTKKIVRTTISKRLVQDHKAISECKLLVQNSHFTC